MFDLFCEEACRAHQIVMAFFFAGDPLGVFGAGHELGVVVTQLENITNFNAPALDRKSVV